MASTARPDFYEVQGRQWRISLGFILILVLAYSLVFALLAFAAAGLADLALGGLFDLDGARCGFILAASAGLALLTAVLQFLSARRSGASAILKRLGALEPDPGDRYHARYLSIVEEMRIAAGLPRTKAYLLPFLAVNCMALVEADGTPAVVASEGLLAEATREELQAAAAHELSHIIKGDVFAITLLCSLADVFERAAFRLAPEDDEPPGFGTGYAMGAAENLAARGLGSLAVLLAASVLRVLSLLVSRERELLADASAVELCRDPMSLARLLAKARLKNTFVGDFSLVYSPMFMISSEIGEGVDARRAALFRSHPPAEKRIASLAAMAGRTFEEVMEQVWENLRQRRRAKRVLMSKEELDKLHPAKEEASRPAAEDEPDRCWSVRGPEGAWQGPLSEEEVVALPLFSPALLVRNERDRVTARAGEFFFLRLAARRAARRQLGREIPAGNARCPRCRRPLRDARYEGAVVEACPSCRGLLVPMAAMDRILVRKEFAFSEELVRKAAEFKKRALAKPAAPSFLCPRCGARMAARPYNYEFFIPVDKCLSCRRVWFDADELESLQILTEKD